MIDRDIIHSLTEDKLKGTDNYLVDVTVSPDNFITVEIDNDRGVSIDDCAALSRHIEAGLDREKEDYELEVGSAGLTAPLKVPRQYGKFIGKEVEISLKEGGKVKGVLKAADETKTTVTVEKKVKVEGEKRKSSVYEDITYDYKAIKQTKYLIRF
ncbi:MAG: ribosome assembly cofactor RimP [Tannerella sp.]|jgi:ribosome maturation factor RimP|nr:ribosome assembly cofactor RimP [Tannerella sp.]